MLAGSARDKEVGRGQGRGIREEKLGEEKICISFSF
jgi:hypothetical protein